MRAAARHGPDLGPDPAPGLLLVQLHAALARHGRRRVHDDDRPLPLARLRDRRRDAPEHAGGLGGYPRSLSRRLHQGISRPLSLFLSLSPSLCSLRYYAHQITSIPAPFDPPCFVRRRNA